jgi:hypothetical protein
MYVFITMDQIQIADYLAGKVFDRELEFGYDVMLKNKQIYPLDDYGKLVESYKISPEDAFVYIESIGYDVYGKYRLPVTYLFPLIDTYTTVEFGGIVSSYLSKLGFYYPNVVYPATGLKYFSVVRLFSDKLVIELTDIDIMATNTGLRKIIVDVLGKDILTQKKLSFDQLNKIADKLREQKVFAGHTPDEAYGIVRRYYEDRNISLIKEVLAIANAYNRIFQPYRVVYDTETRQQVLM